MAAFETKQYRNLFSLIGKEDQEINNRLNEIFETFFYGSEEERIYHPAGEDMGYLEDTGNHDARTEGMSYGMMICVQMDKKEEFDRIWKWACTYMWMEEGESEAILRGPADLTGHVMPMEQLRMGKNSLPWHCFLPLTAGVTGKGFTAIPGRQGRS
ncbi:endoglucanase Y [Firmicutes bacterium CAG:95]|nr:endoglucanase Y [Firmicutes bacterium CAG:95]